MPRPDLAAVAEALRRVGVPERLRSAAALPGGVSNWTFRVDLDDHPSLVLRIQQERGIFDPYDVLREARVLRALAPSPIPCRASWPPSPQSARRFKPPTA